MDFTAYATDNWQDQLELIATKEGFNFTQDEDGDITLQKFSPYGQDFTIELIKPLDYRDALDQLNTQLASYDVNEQAMVWYGANRGEPRDLQDLLEDMKWCKNKLQSLTDAVDYHYGFTPADYFNEAVMKEALSRTFEEKGLADRSFSTDMQTVLLDHMAKYNNPVDGLEEISTHGCASGVLSDFVYYSDTKEFYTKHIDDIEDFIYDLEDDLGESIALKYPRYNSAVWLVAEQCASLASDSLEENIQNTLESEGLTKEQVEAFLQGNKNELIADHLEERLSLLEVDLGEEQSNSMDNLENLKNFIDPKLSEEEIYNRRLTGVQEAYYDNGQLRSRREYRAGKRDGLYERWRDDGQLAGRSHFKADELDGLSEEWRDDGQLAKRATYKAGELDGVFETWYPDGRPKARWNHKAGKLDGLCEQWDDYGNLLSQTHYKDNKKNGLHLEYDPASGEICHWTMFKNDVSVKYANGYEPEELKRLKANKNQTSKVVVPSSPVQEKAQAILAERGERNDYTLKNAQEEQAERKSQSHKL